MANFGSRIMGLFNSLGGGGGGQNLQTTLNSGDSTSNTIRLYNATDTNNFINYSQYSIEVSNDLSEEYYAQSLQSTSMTSSDGTSMTIGTQGINLSSPTHSETISFLNTNGDSLASTMPTGYTDPTTHPIPTLALSQINYVDEINIDTGDTYYIADNLASAINYNCFYEVTRANGTIDFNSTYIAEDVPFYLIVKDGLDYTLTFTSDIGIVTIQNPIGNQLGLFTCIKQRGSEGDAFTLFIQ